jgi:hypothetical protein
MYTLIKLENKKEVSRKNGYAKEENAIHAGLSYLRDCTVHSVLRKNRSINVIDSNGKEIYLKNKA